jgi:hypothetical protein
MNKEEIQVNQPVETRPAFLGRLSWGAIFAGLFMTLVTAILLSLLGVGIGAGSIEPLKEQHPLSGLGIKTLVWLAASGIISSFFGAWISGRAAGAQRRGDGLIHGLVTWGVTTICTGLLTTTAIGSLLGGAASLLGNTVSTTVKAGSTAANQSGVNWDNLKQEIQAKLPQAKGTLTPTGQTDGQAEPQQSPKVLEAVTKMFAKGGAAAAPAEREQVINTLMSEQHMSREDATRQVDEWDQKYQQAKAQTEQKVREAGDVAARGVSRAALGTFGLLVLCAFAAMLGGWAGEVSAFRRTRIVVIAGT